MEDSQLRSMIADAVKKAGAAKQSEYLTPETYLLIGRKLGFLRTQEGAWAAILAVKSLVRAQILEDTLRDDGASKAELRGRLDGMEFLLGTLQALVDGVLQKEEQPDAMDALRGLGIGVGAGPSSSDLIA